MVAHTSSVIDKFVTPPASVLRGDARLLKFTREDTAVLVRLGIVPEDASTELLDGLIVHTDRSARGEDVWRIGRVHRITTERLANLRTQLNSEVRHVESQQPLACNDTLEPQPDFMVVRGRLDEIGDDGPSAGDVFCVVEVADSSYERDSGVKLTGYATAGVPQYVIINLRNRTAEVYANADPSTGTFTTTLIVQENEMLSLRVGEGELFNVPLASVLP
jgi:Uma2 family endonuclease